MKSLSQFAREFSAAKGTGFSVKGTGFSPYMGNAKLTQALATEGMPGWTLISQKTSSDLTNTVEKHPSGAKAHNFLTALMYGLKPVPFSHSLAAEFAKPHIFESLEP